MPRRRGYRLLFAVVAFLLARSPVAAQSGSGGGDDSQITATDGRRLENEPVETRVMFQAVWRNDAGLRWAEEHSAEIDHIQHLDTDCHFRPADLFARVRTTERLRELLWCPTSAPVPIQVFEKSMDIGVGPEQWFQTGDPLPILCLRVTQDGHAGEVHKPSVPSCAEVRQGILTTGTLQLFERGYLLYAPAEGEGLVLSNVFSQALHP